MWSRSNAKTIAAVAFSLAVAAPATGALAGGEVEYTEEKKKICAKADARYKKMYPNAKDDGTVIVKAYKYTFCPPNVTVKVGTTVRWVIVDKRTSHSVWLKEAGIAESERFFPEESWDFTFQAAGDYPYLCGPHWKEEGMVGFVKVTE